MSIAIPILLAAFGLMTFWLLAESKVKWPFKVLCISTFCFFTAVLWIVTPSFLGWGAKDNQLPETVAIRSVIVKEPSSKAKREGGIWFLIEQPAVKYSEPILAQFGHNPRFSEPRLFTLPYSRNLHEALAKGGQNSVIARTQRGQIVRGSLKKGFKGEGEGQGKGKGGKGPKGKGKGKGEGDGSHSQEQEWKFYDLKPSYFQQK